MVNRGILHYNCSAIFLFLYCRFYICFALYCTLLYICVIFRTRKMIKYKIFALLKNEMMEQIGRIPILLWSILMSDSHDRIAKKWIEFMPLLTIVSDQMTRNLKHVQDLHHIDCKINSFKIKVYFHVFFSSC